MQWKEYQSAIQEHRAILSVTRYQEFYAHVIHDPVAYSHHTEILLLMTMQGVFIANNVAIVDRMIQSSELEPLMGSYAVSLEKWRKTGPKMYLEAWREPSAHLLDVKYTNRDKRPQSGGAASTDSAAIVKQLSSKDKDQIKEKFKSFNASFDDLVARYKSYKMEREVRAQLAREVQAIIEPLYGRFWDRYHEIDKGKGKYVKYDKSQLASTLASIG